MKTPNAHFPNKINQSMSVIEVAIQQALDPSVTARYRGAPVLKTYAPAAFLRKPMAEVTHDDFRPVLAGYLLGRPQRDTGYRLISDFNALMSWAVKHGYRTGPYIPFPQPGIQANPLELLSAQDMHAVLEISDRLFSKNLSNSISIRAMTLLGLGVTDTSTFNLDKVDFRRWEYIHNDAQGRLRIIPIPHAMRALLARAHHHRPADEHRSDNTFRPLSGQTLRNLVKRIGEEIGQPNLVPIQLVRTFLHGLPIAKTTEKSHV